MINNDYMESLRYFDSTTLERKALIAARLSIIAKLRKCGQLKIGQNFRRSRPFFLYGVCHQTVKLFFSPAYSIVKTPNKKFVASEIFADFKFSRTFYDFAMKGNILSFPVPPMLLP